jgi:hypothetical protein
MEELHMIKVKFLTFGANSAFGSFGPGDVMSCPSDLAKHLVEEAKVAEYTDTPQATNEDAPQPTAPSRKRQTRGQ